MAPEIFLEESYDNRCDIYSLGCVLYNFLYAKYPVYETKIENLIKLLKERKEIPYFPEVKVSK